MTVLDVLLGLVLRLQTLVDAAHLLIPSRRVRVRLLRRKRVVGVVDASSLHLVHVGDQQHCVAAGAVDLLVVHRH